MCPVSEQLLWSVALRRHLTVSSTLQIDLVQGMMDCLYAECTPCLTDCVLAELEKLGQKYRVALKVAKVSAWLRLQHCQNKLAPQVAG